ncbi:ABC transporter permease [Pseudolysinimonas sp.]|uniref:ABC transporter permease n=1 Tax=Pseudolysinimonas sp. TaxID=2680009 RepID=UPI003783AE2D
MSTDSAGTELVASPRIPEAPTSSGPGRASRLWTGFVGAVVEAWAEVRIHRTQVLLSLIGVGVAVAALAGVVAAGSIATQATVENFERQSGRPASIGLYAYNPMSGESPSRAALDAAFTTAMERYGITYVNRTSYGGVTVQFPDGTFGISALGVDQPYGVMHRIALEQGSWFTERDTLRLAPAIVVSEEVWERLGSPDLRVDPTIGIVTPTGTVDAIIVGITPKQSLDGSFLQAYLLNDDYDTFVPQDPNFPQIPNYEAWVPPEASDQLVPLIQRDVAAALGEDWQVDVQRQDYLAWQTEDPLLIPKVVVIGIAVLVMLLGALGLLNIALVSVKHRIREIGIRRAFGATAGRVFFSVMMESVVATFVAGLAGVLLAIVLVKNPITDSYLALVIQDIPGFPIEAALIGLGAATLVGALAGLLPALVAVRVKVIDAIRY